MSEQPLLMAYLRSSVRHEVFDTHGCGYNCRTSPWKFTAPVAGTYSISDALKLEAAGTGEKYVEVFGRAVVVYARGTQHLLNASLETVKWFQHWFVVPGDYIDIRMFQSSGVSR